MPSTHTVTENQVYPILLIKNLACIYSVLNHSLIPELGTFITHFICKAAASHIPRLNVAELPRACCRGKWRSLVPWFRTAISDKCEVLLPRNMHLRGRENLIIMNSAPYSSSCLTITFPLQSNNNLNTNRREAFQKVMNSEALEPRQPWFKCRAPATQRSYQLYSLPSRKQKSYFKESLPERERKWRKCHRNHTTQSKQFQENRWVAKSCQRQSSPPRGKKDRAQ